jgi:lactoylglutathione lyase
LDEQFKFATAMVEAAMIKPVHMMLRVMDERRSVAFYERAFGLKVVDRFEFKSFALLYLQSREKNFELELTINHDRDKPYAVGDGYGHLAFLVDDLSVEHNRMMAEGVQPEPIKELENAGKPMARFFFVTDPDGYRIEVLQKFGRYV